MGFNFQMENKTLKPNGPEIQPPYYLALGLDNYGGRILTTENTDLDQLTSLHSEYLHWIQVTLWFLDIYRHTAHNSK